MYLLKFSGDPFLARNPWKIHEEYGLLCDDITKNAVNPQHQRPQNNWKLSRPPATAERRKNAPQNDDGHFHHKITIANGLFVQNGFSIRPDYRSAVLGVYQSNIRNLDFAGDMIGSTRYINE